MKITKAVVRKYILNVLIGIDETCNALRGHDGKETISSSVGKAALRGGKRARFWEKVVNFIMRNPNHCREAIEPNVGQDGVIAD